MAYDTQDALLALRKLAHPEHGQEDVAHERADKVLLRLIDDDRVTEAYNAIPKWYS